MDTISSVPQPVNEAVHEYAPGSPNGKSSRSGSRRWRPSRWS